MEITAAGIAKELKVSPREARVKLRAAGIRAPYKPSDVPKMKAIIRGDKPKAGTGKPKAKKLKPIDEERIAAGD